MKNKSIFVEGFEDFINSELIDRPFKSLSKIENDAMEKNFPIISPMSGAVLAKLISIFLPKKILELGTGLGYSLLWILSSGHKPEKILTIDRGLESIEYAKSKLVEEKIDCTVEFLNEWILEYLKKNSIAISEFDLIFIDCDKVCYPELLDLLLENAKQNTVLIFDNVLWHSRIMNKAFTKPSDLAMQQFWEKIKINKIPSTLFPSGDGLLLIEKKFYNKP